MVGNKETVLWCALSVAKEVCWKERISCSTLNPLSLLFSMLDSGHHTLTGRTEVGNLFWEWHKNKTLMYHFHSTHCYLISFC